MGNSDLALYPSVCISSLIIRVGFSLQKPKSEPSERAWSVACVALIVVVKQCSYSLFLAITIMEEK